MVIKWHAFEKLEKKKLPKIGMPLLLIAEFAHFSVFEQFAKTLDFEEAVVAKLFNPQGLMGYH